ncbi:NUDIX hydrolase [Enterococcus hermanniensis]|uniref:ADP-ribose pyrophosphatase n=1 Tax=Enterococcus hermanniensis TaxID=249189 RepID=A0A1L8TS51_9ENTE|nr:NUDIX hydrolase [Enterococcus hermanniensis]OJG47156.1 ADP-ribose pyrophosphatase [Enterococcus hermanniensis]
MLEYKDFEEKTIERTEIFKGKIIDVYLDDVALPMGGTAKRELVFHHGGVGIIPITSENKMIMVKQFRKPLEKVVLEIPAGKIDPGEGQQPEKTASRELEEETGYRSDNLKYINEMYLSPGFSNEKLYVYLATDLVKVEHPRPQDEDEVLELYELTLTEAQQAIQDGSICDAKTIFAVNYWELLQYKQG